MANSQTVNMAQSVMQLGEDQIFEERKLVWVKTQPVHDREQAGLGKRVMEKQHWELQVGSKAKLKLFPPIYEGESWELLIIFRYSSNPTTQTITASAYSSTGQQRIVEKIKELLQ